MAAGGSCGIALKVYGSPTRGREWLGDLVNGGADVNEGQPKGRRGFASMSPEKQREIASKGGRAAHVKGTAHEWTAEEARTAGRKGGQISHARRGHPSTQQPIPAETAAELGLLRPGSGIE